MTPITALKSALLDHLQAQAGAAFAGKIFDEVPRDDQGEATSADAPFLYLGPVGWQRLEGGEDGPGYTVRLRLYIVSTAFGREEGWDLAETVRAALEGRDVNDRLAALGGHAQTSFRVMSSGDVVTPLDPKQVFLEISTELFSASP